MSCWLIETLSCFRMARGEDRYDSPIGRVTGSELLLLAWKSDTAGARREVILELAGLHQPAPIGLCRPCVDMSCPPEWPTGFRPTE